MLKLLVINHKEMSLMIKLKAIFPLNINLLRKQKHTTYINLKILNL